MVSQVEDMFNNGILKHDEHGRFQAVIDPNESEHIKSNMANQTKRRPINEADIDRINQDLDKMEDDNV
jgi:hypothetical protein